MCDELVNNSSCDIYTKLQIYYKDTLYAIESQMIRLMFEYFTPSAVRAVMRYINIKRFNVYRQKIGFGNFV